MGLALEDREEGKKWIEDEEDELPLQRKGRPDGGGPPDGGWGWCVMFASFCNIMVLDGTCFSFGDMIPEYMLAFGASDTQVGWVGSSLVGCYLLVGPFVSALCARFGCRRVTILGSIVSMIGFVLSTRATSVEMLIVTYGIIGGIGFGMIYLPSIVCVGQWFNKKRAFTTGIALCGSGVGQFLFPPLTRYLLTEYHWEGKNLIMAGIVLQCAVFGMMFWPLDKRHNNGGSRYRKYEHAKVEIEHGAIMKALIEDKKRQRTISNGSLDNCIITRDNRLIKLDPKLFECKRNNSFIARFKRQLGFSSQSLACSKNSLQGIPTIVIDAVQNDLNNTKMGSPIYRPNGTATRVQQLSHSHSLQKRGSLPNGSVVSSSIPNGVSSTTPTPVQANGSVVSSSAVMMCNGGVGGSGSEKPNSGTVKMPNGMPKTRSCDTLPEGPWFRASQEDGLAERRVVTSGLQLQQGSSSGCTASPPGITRSANDLQFPASLDGSVISIQLIQNGPAAESLQNMRYRSSRSMASDYSTQLSGSQASYVASSVLSIPQTHQSLEELEREIERQDSMLWRMWRILCDMCDLKLLLNPMFALLVFSSFVTLLAFFIPYFYLPDKGKLIGMDAAAVSFLVPIIGITNTVGRVLSGWLADRPWISTLWLNNSFLILTGLSLLFCPLCESQTQLAIVAAFMGLCLAVFNSLRSILLVDLLGLEMLNKSFGILILFQGMGAFIGAPMAGKVKDLTGSVDNTFYMSGALMILSGVLMFPLHCFKDSKRCQEQRQSMVPFIPQAMAINGTLKIETGI